MRYNDNYYLNFSTRIQKNLIDCGFNFIDEQVHTSTSRKFWVYEKTYELQLFLSLFRINREKNLGYQDCQLIKFYKQKLLLPNTNIEDYGIVENKFTKPIDIKFIL